MLVNDIAQILSDLYCYSDTAKGCKTNVAIQFTRVLRSYQIYSNWMLDSLEICALSGLLSECQQISCLISF